MNLRKTKPQLESVTIVCITGVQPIKSLISLLKSASKMRFKKILLITNKLPSINLGKFSIQKPIDSRLDSIDEYSYYCIYKLHAHVSTEYCLIVQADSGIDKVNLWLDEFLGFDYIGAPWPLSDDAYIDPFGNHQRVGNGGFSLRSKKLLEVPLFSHVEWNPNSSNFYRHMNANSFSEDGNICVHNRHIYESAGCQFAPLEIALKFSRELPVSEYQGTGTFGYHKYK